MKRTKKLVLLLAVLLVAVIACVVVMKFIEADKVTQTEGSYDVTDIVFEEITGLAWTAGEEEIAISKVAGEWVNLKDADFPLDGEAADELARLIAGLRATVKVEGAEDLSDYGLAEGAFAVKVTLSDGSVVTFTSGDENKIIEATYVKSDLSADVYAIEAGLDESFGTLYDLIVWDELPPADDRYSITVENADGVVFSAVRVDNPAEYYYGDGYKWFLADTLDAIPVPLDYTACATICRTMANLKFQDCVSYWSDEAMLEAYGLASPTVVTMLSHTEGEDGATVEQPTYVLHIGSAFTVTDESGMTVEYYYAKVPESEVIYSVLAEKADAVMKFDLSGYLPMQLLKLDFEDVTGLTFAYNSEVRAYESVIETVTEDVLMADGTTETDTYTQVTVTLNGAAVDADAFETAVKAFTTMAVESRLEADDAEERSLVYSITLNTAAEKLGEITVNLYEYSSDFYLVEYLGDRTVLVSASTADDILRQFRNIK